MQINKLTRWKEIPSKVERVIKRNLNLVISGIKTSEKVVGITFDDGPHPEYTPRILDLLDKYQAKATFFVVGESAQKYPSVIQRISESGHAIGNHTWSHVAIPLIKRRERFRQVRNTQKVVEIETEKLFRPPWGFMNVASYADVKLLGYKIIYWDVAAFDWLDPTPEEIFQRLDSSIHPGSIILLHDNIRNTIKPEYVSRDNLIKGLDKYLDKHVSTYKFITVPQLLKIGKPKYIYGLRRKKNMDAVIPANVTN